MMIRNSTSNRAIAIAVIWGLLLVAEIEKVAGSKTFRDAPMTYHGGPLLTGNVNIAILYYGVFSPLQMDTLRNFIDSLNAPPGIPEPSVSSWWRMVESYQLFIGPNARGGGGAAAAGGGGAGAAAAGGGAAAAARGGAAAAGGGGGRGKGRGRGRRGKGKGKGKMAGRSLIGVIDNVPHPPPRIQVRVVSTIIDPSYSVGKVMTMDFIKMLVNKATAGNLNPNTLALIFTDKQVTVQDLCTGRCAQHGVIDEKQPFVIVGDPELECPDACEWPFHRIDKGPPQGVILKPPNGEIEADVMIMELAEGLADAVTNPFNNGFFQPGPLHAGLLGAGTKCKDTFASGASPGNPGLVHLDPRTGGAFNVNGIANKKFLLPGIWNPATSSCWTPI